MVAVNSCNAASANTEEKRSLWPGCKAVCAIETRASCHAKFVPTKTNDIDVDSSAIYATRYAENQIGVEAPAAR